MKAGYVPDAGDVVWLTFDPQAGHEQRGRRPALVVSPRTYNRWRRLALVCPITSQAKGHSFEVTLPPDSSLAGVVLADHLKSVDWRVRRAKFATSAPSAVLTEVREKLRPLLGL